MNRRILAAMGGALPAMVCAALALLVFSQEGRADVVVADGGIDADGGVGTVDGGEADGGMGDAQITVTNVPVVTAPALALPVPAQKQPLEPGADVDTGIKGHVYDAKTKQPMALAPVLLKGASKTRTALTDEHGGFQLLVPPGAYSLMSYYDLYHGARIKGVKVARGKFLNLNLMLFPLDENEEVSIQEFEIAYRADTTSAAAQDQLRLASSSIGEGFGAKQMSQVGASDAGGAAARVVGVQVEDNQLVIRGLGGRYTRVLLNGVPVPSTDPDLPGADLDLFPTSVIDSLNISKTFLPSNPADFAGGLMEIKSVSFPRKFTLEIGLSSGYRTVGTFEKTPTYAGGKYDFLGFDDGRRGLPDTVPKDAQVVTSNSGSFRKPQELDTVARGFRNSWSYNRTTALPPLGVSLNLGNSYKFGNGHRFGYVATTSYDYELVRKLGRSRPRPAVNADGTLQPLNDYRLDSGSEEVGLSAFGSASLDLGSDHSFTLLTLANRSVSDSTVVREGQNQNLGGFVSDWQLEFLARSLTFNQLVGDHRNLGGTRLRLRWVAFQSTGSMNSPDRRLMLYSEQQGRLEWVGRAGSGERIFANLGQVDLGVTMSLRFPLWAEAWGTVGGWGQSTSRDFTNRRFRANKISDVNNPAALDAYTAPGEVLFSPSGIGTLTRFSEATLPTDSYKAKQSLLAGFALIETPVVGKLSLAAGVRVELFPQRMEVKNPFGNKEIDPTKATGTDRTDVNYLPGGNLKYAISDTMIMRAAYGVTVSRPMARELAPFQFFDFLRDRSIEGNPLLKTTIINNADLRWEWFFGEGQVLALSTFYKTFRDPIELVILNPDYQSQYRNGKGATNFGGEAEVRLNLGRLSKALKYFDLDSNLSLIRSRVELNAADAGATVASRRLFGQAPYLANVGVRFHHPDTKVGVSLVYNVVGPRISDVGIRAADIIMPNVEEQPFHSLDLIGSWQFSSHLKTKLKIRNLLLQDLRLNQGELEIQRLQPGLSASLSLAYEY